MSFIKLIRSESTRILMKDRNAFMLLTQIAHRAKRSDSIKNGLELGQALIGDYDNIGLTKQEYRSAKNRLKEMQQATFKPTNKGTIATLISSDIYDINIEDTNTPSNTQATHQQHTSNTPATPNKKLRSKEDKKKENTSADEEPFYLTSKGNKLTDKRLTTFEDFWKAFDYKKSKADAAESWYRIPSLPDALVVKIIEAAKLEAKGRDALKAKGRTPKMAQGWLTSRRWEDEAVPDNVNNKPLIYTFDPNEELPDG